MIKTMNLLIAFIMLVASSSAATGEFLVIDISGGNAVDNYDVVNIDNAPAEGWGDEFKTTKIVLKRIDVGNKAYYIGIFEITQRQWELVMGSRPSYYKNDECYAKRPVEKVSYDDIRGNVRGARYPESKEVDDGSFIGILRSRTRLVGIDLPTRRQWELACKSPSGWSAEDNPADAARYARLGVNSGFYLYPEIANRECGVNNGTAEVGSYLPNEYGIYDMHGNVCEWCLDQCDEVSGEAVILESEGRQLYPLGKTRVIKGGNCEVGNCGFFDGYKHYVRGMCRDRSCMKRQELVGRYLSSKVIYAASASFSRSNVGFRIVIAQ